MDSEEPVRAGLGEPGAAPQPAGLAVRGAGGETGSAMRAEAAGGVEPGAVESPRIETAGPLAVQINASPWANIEVDGIDLGATPLANVPLLSGKHAFRAEMPDGRIIERTVEIDAETRFISFE